MDCLSAGLARGIQLLWGGERGFCDAGELEVSGCSKTQHVDFGD